MMFQLILQYIIACTLNPSLVSILFLQSLYIPSIIYKTFHLLVCNDENSYTAPKAFEHSLFCYQSLVLHLATSLHMHIYDVTMWLPSSTGNHDIFTGKEEPEPEPSFTVTGYTKSHHTVSQPEVRVHPRLVCTVCAKL